MKQLSAVGFLFVILVTSCSARDGDFPEPGSIRFGAEEAPDIPSYEEFAGQLRVPAEVAEVVLPTVVSITSTKIDTVVYRNPFGDDLFRHFFGMPSPPRGRDDRREQYEKREQRRSGIGSGVIVSDSGYILTNSHVIHGADEITVRLYDEREYTAEIIGVDTLSDVGVIRINESFDSLPVIHLGDSDALRPGDWVMAAGNPFNLNSTVTSGIVSALGRRAAGNEMYQDFIQTDAAINPGNSGGALVNKRGDLIGINTMIYTRSGGYMGIGFAIPINMARSIMEQLVYSGTVSRGWLGVSIGELDYNMMRAFGLEERGVLINDVFEDQPAAEGGIESGDVILAIDGIRTVNPNDLRNVVAAILPDTEVPVRLFRNGEEITRSVVMGDRADFSDEEPRSRRRSDAEDNLVFDRLGIHLSASDGDGFVIDRLEPTSPAARAGLQEDDVVVELRRQGRFIPIESLSQLENAVKETPEGSSLVLRIIRQGRPFFAAIRL
ncbi:Do family serine endopeptidase [Chitinivibrio alkaliphilus]|uniref:Periplasmic serine protease, Do/DeqQ family n=1 Tax=Chitinivibrio alkaliphilus ACht1 TaxID=1313304 RepID=U7DAC6_9BACT|nr:Do family serine endopeptidase [Chitinivibrio alkaliphilus]ERP32087.1 periplasmic serine protease, Do/DeqQ family [Chitinivibrio alkaliphilus ACht1]